MSESGLWIANNCKKRLLVFPAKKYYSINSLSLISFFCPFVKYLTNPTAETIVQLASIITKGMYFSMIEAVQEMPAPIKFKKRYRKPSDFITLLTFKKKATNKIATPINPIQSVAVIIVNYCMKLKARNKMISSIPINEKTNK